MSANGEDVKNGANQVKDAYRKLIRAIEEGGDTVGASSVLASRMQKLSEDTKGNYFSFFFCFFILLLSLSFYGWINSEQNQNLYFLVWKK
jgi:hypothetical protein